MASADDPSPLRRSSSLDWLPPSMSELRVVLLGNSWSERASVGNFILRETAFKVEEEPNQSFRVSGTVDGKKIALINTPDLLKCNISQQELTDHVENCASASNPGPHVFLLVLQPEDFTDKCKWSLCRILETFSERSFDHSLVLISTSRQESSGFRRKYKDYPPLKYIIKRCKYRYLKRKHLGHSELLACLGQIVKENKEEHVIYEAFEDPADTLPEDQSPKQKGTPLIQSVLDPRTLGLKGATQQNFESEKHPLTETAGLRIVLLGKSEDKQTKLGNFIIRREAVSHSKLSQMKHCESASGQWRGKPVTVVKTPNLFSLTVEAVRREVKSCVSLCPPGPNVLLLLVKPSKFSEENRETLNFILGLFGPDAFKHSMIIQTHKENTHSTAVKQLIEDCGGRYHEMTQDDHEILMVKIESLVHEEKGAFPTQNEESIRSKSEKMKPALNLVLCGRGGAGKSSAAEAILGQTGLHSASTSSECVRHQGKVCGRWVSLVDLPALSGKPLETVMKESLRSVSLCDPAGVHAFILVLPVGPLTDEDKGEIKIIQDTFSSKVNDFTMILFTTESDPTGTVICNFLNNTQEIQELIQSCGGRNFVLNMKNQLQGSELLDNLEKMRMRPYRDNLCSYKTETFAHAQIRKISTLQAKLEETKGADSCDDEMQSSECLRIVLIGKTGNGKSSSGNTILRREEFKAKSSQTSVTKDCQKVHGEVDGRPVAVVDTPGLFDTSWSHEQVYDEMIKCFSLLAPGPHVFLLVLRIGRLTDEEKGTLKLIREGFGKDAEKFTIVLLTGGDNLRHDKVSIEEYIETECDDSFKKLISDCGDRYHVFDNRDDKNREQVSELMAKIDKMVKTNGGSCFTNEMLQDAEAAIKKKMEKLMKKKEEEMRREREELQRKHEEEMKEMVERMKKQEEDMKGEREKRERELEEKEEMIKKEKEEKVKEKEKREQEDRERKHQEELQRLEWKQKCEALEKQMKLESEEKESVYGELEKSKEKIKEERENTEKQQKEWWEKRNQEEEERRQEEQMKLRKLQEKFEQERENYEKKRREEDLKRQNETEKLNSQQREEVEKERKQKEEELKEMEDNIKKEREARVREQQMREEEDRKRREQEEHLRMEWKRKHEELKRKIQLESKKKENIDQQLEETKEKMREERENWERRQEEWWQKRNQEEEQRKQEEETKIKKLQDEFEQEKRNDEKKRKEEEQRRHEKEEKEKKRMEEDFKTKLEEMEKKHENDARIQAERHNEFIEDKNKEFFAKMEKKQKEYDSLKELSAQKESSLRQQQKEKQEQYDLLFDLSAHNEEGFTQVLGELQLRHKQEMADLTVQLLIRKDNYDDITKETYDKVMKAHFAVGMKDLKEKLKKELDILKKDLLAQNERKENEQTEQLQKKHNQEMEDTKRSENQEEQGSKGASMKMSEKHVNEMKELKTELKNRQEEVQKIIEKLQKEYAEKMEQFETDVFEKMKGLQLEHNKKMKALNQKQKKGGARQQQKDDLQKKHEEALNQQKVKCLTGGGGCSIL